MDDFDKRWRTAMDDVGKKPPQAAAAKLREVSEEELRQILAAHKAWVETDGEEGEWANLASANLQAANLFGANLTKAKNLTREQLDEACGDDKTTLPDYLAD